MATIEQLAEGIKRAHAAGDAAAVQKLGAAYRKMQGQPTAGDQAMAAASAASGKLKGKVADLPSQRPSFGDEAMSFGRGIIEGIPIAGPTLADWRQGLDANISSLFTGGNADEIKAGYKAADEELRGKTGGARLAGNVTGSVAALAPLGMTALGGRLLGTTGTLGQRLVAGGLSGSAISGADTAARGGDLGQIATNAAVGAGLGLALPAAGGIINRMGNKSAQTSAINSAIKDAPTGAELAKAGSALFTSSKAANTGVTPGVFGGLTRKLVDKVRAADIDPTLDGEAVAAYQKMIQMANEAMESGQGVSLSRLHNLRQIAQDVVVDATKNRTKSFARDIVNGLDEMISSLKPDQIVGSGGKQAANELMEGISVWSRAKKVSTLEGAFYRAQNAASGFENGLRVEFRKLLQNDDLRKQFSKLEIEAIEQLVRGTSVSNAMKLLGKFGFGPGANGLGGFLGGTAGFTFGGPLGAAAMAVGASGARKVSEKLTEKAADRVAKMVATPNVPVIPPRALPNGVIPPALLPLESTKKRKPIEIEVRGGAR